MWDRSFAPFLAGMEAYFGRVFPPMTTAEVADHYRARGGRAVLLAWDAETSTKLAPFTSHEVAAMVAEHPDVFVGFGSVDPHKGAAAIAGANEAKRLGLRGLKFHPPAQRFSPSDKRVYPIWEVAEELELPVLIHTGFTAMGAGEPGGLGVELALGDPMLVDRVAVDFPRLTIILAHPSWPFEEQAIAVARHKSNVYLELSGWSPKYLSRSLLDAVTGPLVDRTLFGTDFPFITPDKWLKDWATLAIPEDVTRKIVHDNAAELLQIG